MSTRQSQLFLLLVQVMIYSRNVRGYCFINTATKCTSSLTRDKAIYKFNYKFSLDGNYFINYFCNYQLKSVEGEHFAEEGDSFTLTPGGAGKGCGFFKYQFEDGWLDLTAEDASTQQYWLTFALDQNSAMWDLPFRSLMIDDMTAEGNAYTTNKLHFGSGPSTTILSRFLIPSMMQGKSSHTSRLQVSSYKSLLLIARLCPTQLQHHDVEGLVFVMGKDLPKSVLFAFTKKTENGRDEFAIMLRNDKPVQDPDVKMVAGTNKKTKSWSPFNCLKNQECGSSSKGNAGTKKEVVQIELP